MRRGAWRSRPRVSAHSATTCSWGTSATARSTRTTSRTSRSRGSSAARTAARSSSTACGESRSAMGSSSSRPIRSSLRRDPTTKATGCTGGSTRRGNACIAIRGGKAAAYRALRREPLVLGGLRFACSVLRAQRGELQILLLALLLQRGLALVVKLRDARLLEVALLLLLLGKLVGALRLELLAARLAVQRQRKPARVRRLAARALELDRETQLVRGIGIADRLLVADVVVVVELEQRPVERAHAELAALRHDRLDLVEVALEDLVGDRRRVDQDLDRGLAAFTVLHADQPLRHDRAQIRRKIHQQLAAPLLGEEVDD